MERFKGLIVGRAQGLNKEFLQHCPLEAFDKAVGLRRANTGAVMLNVVKRQVDLVRMVLDAIIIRQPQFACFKCQYNLATSGTHAVKYHIFV